MNIGLTQRILSYNDISYDSIEHGWYTFLNKHELTFVSNRLDQEFDAMANQLDALIITGGDDSPLRRVVETKLAAQMLAKQKPIIGICHGCFLLTTLLGGEVGEIENHHGVDHAVTYNGQEYTVNSYHSLCVNKPPPSAISLAQDGDCCEAWIDGKIAGVVWHPERMMNPWLPPEIESLLT